MSADTRFNRRYTDDNNGETRCVPHSLNKTGKSGKRKREEKERATERIRDKKKTKERIEEGGGCIE